MITARLLTKQYKRRCKESGALNQLRALFFPHFEEKLALHPLSFTIQPGETVGLIGANGAGKTTLVKMMTGILHPSDGFLEVLGYKPFQRKANFCRSIGLMMGQKSQLFWDLPALDSFNLLKEIYSLSSTFYKTRLEELSTLLQVENQLHIPLRQLSLGERMKMELLASLLHQPSLLFLDEPTLGLDATTQLAIRSFLLQQQKGASAPTLVLTSHYMEDIVHLCPRVLFLKEGKLVYDGAIETLVKQYTSHKKVTVQLSEDNHFSSLKTALQQLPYEQIPTQLHHTLSWRVARDEVPAMLQILFRKGEICDVTVEEEELNKLAARLLQQP